MSKALKCIGGRYQPSMMNTRLPEHEGAVSEDAALRLINP